MLMKRIGKMKQKKGAVLFAVIAVMSLLIAMASTAYYTAKSAYNSVVSNYDYSQLYLSAISVSDMVAQAVTNDSASTATGVGINNYTPLRDAILTMETPGESITAYSSNISTPSGSEQTILSQLATTDSVIAGVLDGVTVKIELVDNTQYMPISPNPMDLGNGYYCYWFEYDYKFTTTAYYRNNSITVEDIVVSSKSKIWEPDPGSPGYPGTDPVPGDPGTPGNPGNSTVTFSRFFTSTGQVISDGGSGADIVRTSRIVKIETKAISDDAFFQNESTFFVNGNENVFLGSITSTGSIYLDKFQANIQGSDNDWYIGKDLVIAGSNANNLDLNNNGQYDNNLYVGGNLVLSGDGPSIKATEIYVDGDLYILGQANITGDLHVNGNIYYEIGDTYVDESGNESPSAKVVAESELPDGLKYDSYSYTNPWSVSGELSVNGTVNYNSNGQVNISTGNGTAQVADGALASTSDVISTFNPADESEVVVNHIPDPNGGDYYVDDVQTVTGIDTIIGNQAGTNIEYSNYTSPQTAYDNVITIDFGLLTAQDSDGDGTDDSMFYEDTSTHLKIEADGTAMNTGNFVVTIPFNYNGCALDIDTSDLGNSVNVTYKIETEGTLADGTTGAGTMPIVLLDNITAPDGSKGFSWQGDSYSTNSDTWSVIADGDGNVVFEMANIDASGNYVPYNPNNYENLTSVQYVAGEKEVVGTQAQYDVLGPEGIEASFNGSTITSNADVMYQSGTSIPKTEYENHFMLVSNANNAVGIDMARIDNTFCGYIYAPNAELNNYYANGGTNPVFGGMIVSTYTSDESYLFYAEPKPSLISEMLGSLTSSIAGSTPASPGTPATPDIPGTPGVAPTDPPGTGTWHSPIPADYWNVAGSNYVG